MKPFRASRALAIALAASLLAACITVKGGKEGKKDDDAAAALKEFAKAAESLDVDRVTSFYAKDAFSEVLDRAPRHTTGNKSLREDVARTLAPVAAMHVEPVGDVRAWKDGDHAWTIQDFHITGSLKDGRGFGVDVHYSAVWRKTKEKDKDGRKKWLVEYEHFTGPRPTVKVTAPEAVPAK